MNSDFILTVKEKELAEKLSIKLKDEIKALLNKYGYSIDKLKNNPVERAIVEKAILNVLRKV